MQTEWSGSRIQGLIPDHILHVTQLPGWPNGRRGLLMAQLWDQLAASKPAGILWVDPDIAADPDDLAAMREAVEASPGAMHTGCWKLWPASTSRPDWIWSHRTGTLGQPVATQDESAPVAYISNGFLWTPAALIDLARPQLPQWRWADIDVGLSELSWLHGIDRTAVHDCRPKHLHF